MSDPAPNPQSPARYYYGWNMVALATATGLFSVGIVFYTHGVFRSYLIEDFGFTAGETFEVYALHIAVVALLSFAVTPRMIERIGAKRTILIGCFCLSLGLFLVGLSPNKLFYFVVFATLIAFGNNCMGMIATRTTLVFWFEARRAQALSFAAMGITAGGILHVPVTTWVIEHYGWRVTYQLLGLTVLTMAPIVALFWKNRPEDIGLEGEPAHWKTGFKSAPSENAPAMNSKQILSNGVFLLVALSLGTSSACWSVILQSLVSDFREQGFSPHEAAGMFSVLTTVILIGKPLYGPVGDKIDRKWAILWTLLMQFAALGLFLLSRFYRPFAFEFFGTPSDAALLSAMVLFGIGVGGCQPLYSAYMADLFGKHTFVRAAGISVPLVIGCQLVGYLINGIVVDATQTLLWMWYVMSGFYVVSLVLLMLVPRAGELAERSPSLYEGSLVPSAIDSELIQDSSSHAADRHEP
ncbi:MAG: MFS transporter [Chrysiogenetes bacterium]|nr:MFS transporter [Chrysiogenetes bacterium]